MLAAPPLFFHPIISLAGAEGGERAEPRLGGILQGSEEAKYVYILAQILSHLLRKPAAITIEKLPMENVGRLSLASLETSNEKLPMENVG